MKAAGIGYREETVAGKHLFHLNQANRSIIALAGFGLASVPAALFFIALQSGMGFTAINAGAISCLVVFVVTRILKTGQQLIFDRTGRSLTKTGLLNLKSFDLKTAEVHCLKLGERKLSAQEGRQIFTWSVHLATGNRDYHLMESTWYPAARRLSGRLSGLLKVPLIDETAAEPVSHPPEPSRYTYCNRLRATKDKPVKNHLALLGRNMERMEGSRAKRWSWSFKSVRTWLVLIAGFALTGKVLHFMLPDTVMMMRASLFNPAGHAQVMAALLLWLLPLYLPLLYLALHREELKITPEEVRWRRGISPFSRWKSRPLAHLVEIRVESNRQRIPALYLVFQDTGVRMKLTPALMLTAPSDWTLLEHLKTDLDHQFRQWMEKGWINL